jgi:hypothetical protein
VLIPLESQLWHLRHLRHQRANKGLGSSSPLEGKNGWEKDTLSNGQIWKNLILLVIFFVIFFCHIWRRRACANPGPCIPWVPSQRAQKDQQRRTPEPVSGRGEVQKNIKKKTTTLKSIRRETSRRYLHVFNII